MPSQKNQATLKLLQEKLKQTKSIVLADYRGLSVNLQRQLRNQVKAVNGEFIVVKNSILQLALKAEKIDLPRDFTEILRGPTITLFAYEDAIAPIKALAEFAKIHELPIVKTGFLSREALSAGQVHQLAALPTKIELLAQIIATLQSPLNGFVNVLSGNIKKLVTILKAVKSK